MQHFVKDDKFNIFRLPVGWQYLVNNKLGGNLDSGNIAKYDQLLQACLATGASCVIDVSAPFQETRALLGWSESLTAPF
jgi:endoglucanase